RRASRWPIVVLVLFVLLVGGGAALSMTEHGLFGRYFFEQFLPAAGTPAQAKGILDAAEGRARTDTYVDVRASLRDLAEARRGLGLNRTLLARSIAHEALYQARFGADPASNERIVRALGRLEERHGAAPGMDLARAAAALARGDAASALSQIARARGSAPSDAYVELLAGEASLAQGDTAAAAAAFEKAASLGAGARATYGQARALRAAGAD